VTGRSTHRPYLRPNLKNTVMRSRLLLFPILAALLLGSCVPKKKYAALQASNETLLNKLDNANRDLEACRAAKASADARIASLETANQHLNDRVSELSVTNAALLNNVGNMATLSAQEAINLEKSLERIKEKDLQIRRLQDALDKQDSITLALVVSLKSSLGNLNDTDVVVNVEKSVVFISLSDKMLFKSGSTEISANAKNVLAKVATVVNDKPEMEVLVEGHTDDVPIKRDCIKDNWDLSVLRATAITRVLTQDLGVDPSRVTAGGRSQFVPLVPNDSAENKAKNRRTRIVIMPKLDEFYKMVEDGLKQAEQLD
jgi:chemotaxis protein MotB